MHHCEIAIQNVIHYTKYDDGWKIDSLKAFMTSESGNTLLLKDWWKLIDYSIQYGTTYKNIDGIKDNPWKFNSTDIKSDEEKIQDLFNRYCWDIDTGDFKDLYHVGTLNIECGFEKGTGVEEWANSLEEKWYRFFDANGKALPREACWNHINHVRELNIVGDELQVNYSVLSLIEFEIGFSINSTLTLSIIHTVGIWNL